jgi:hypothetical protein
VLPDAPEPPSDDSDRSDPETSGEEIDSHPGRKKLPAGWKPEHANRKKPVPVFVEEPDPSVTPSLFADKRYEGFRRQMVLAAVFAVLFFIALGVLYWFRPIFFPDEELQVEAPPAPVEKVPSLSAEELQQEESESVRGKLRVALAERNWAEIDRQSRRILQREPADGEAWHAQGWVFEKNRAYAEALDAYSKAISAGFLPSSCLVKRATMNRRLGKFPEAVADLEASINQDREPIVPPNLLMIAQIQAGQAEEVRKSIDSFEKMGIVANSDRYLLGKAALEIHDGNFPKAANSLAAFQTLVSPALFAVLAQDAFFDPYRTQPDLVPYLVVP